MGLRSHNPAGHPLLNHCFVSKHFQQCSRVTVFVGKIGYEGKKKVLLGELETAAVSITISGRLVANGGDFTVRVLLVL